MFEVIDKPISAKEVRDAVWDETAGAIVIFEGIVRRYSRGKRVSYLDYESYKAMAEKKLAEVAAEIHAKWGIEKVAVRHRVGHLEIGDVAVAIAVASPHRREAFAACEYAIDRIKRIVPIWKKEVWEDGEEWIGWEGAE